MFTEKIISLFGGLFVTVYTARYLGPEKLGTITYLIALSSFIVPISEFGIKTLTFDKAASNKIRAQELIRYTGFLRISLYIFISLLLILYVNVSVSNTFEMLFCLIILLASDFFKAIDVYSSYFNATLLSKVNAISNQIGLLFSHIVRLVLIQINASYFYFSLPYLALTIVPYYIKKYKYNKECVSFEIKRRKSVFYKNYILSAGLPLALSEFSILIYVKIGQIILSNNVGNIELGIYTAVLTITQVWVFIPITISNVILTKVFNDKENKNNGFVFVFQIASIVSICIIVVLGYFNTYILTKLYGDSYIKGVEIFNIMLLSSFFVVIGTISYRIIIHTHGYKFLMKKMLVTAILNIIISYFLISYYGLLGAAYSVLLTEILSAIIFNFLYKDGMIIKLFWHCFKISNFSYIKGLIR